MAGIINLKGMVLEPSSRIGRSELGPDFRNQVVRDGLRTFGGVVPGEELVLTQRKETDGGEHDDRQNN